MWLRVNAKHVFSGLTAATVLFGLVRAMLFFYVLVKSTETLHKRMFDTILRAPVHFFDVNPIGRRSRVCTPLLTPQKFVIIEIWME